MKKLDARKYMWKEADGRGAFGLLGFLGGRSAVGEVHFDENTFEKTDWERNGVHLTFYGSGSISEYGAMELSDGVILFCIVWGSAFADTFHSAEKIRMKYYLLTKL